MPPNKFIIRQAQKKGRRYGVKPSDLLELIENESSFNPNAVSSANARGLTQFIPSTAASYGVKYGSSKRAQKTQIRGAAKYLKDLGYKANNPAAIRKSLAGYYGAASPYAEEVVGRSPEYERYDKGGKLAQGSTPKGLPKARRVQVSPGQSNVAERRALALSFIQKENKTASDYISFAQEKKSLADVPARYKTVGGAKKLGKAGKEEKALHGTGKGGIIQIGRLAQQMGLYVGENPKFGGVDPVHATGSYHYSGRAIDVSGDPNKMRKFAQKVDKLYGKRLAELFWNGAGAVNRDNGKKVPKGFVSGHTDHVHVAL